MPKFPYKLEYTEQISDIPFPIMPTNLDKYPDTEFLWVGANYRIWYDSESGYIRYKDKEGIIRVLREPYIYDADHYQITQVADSRMPQLSSV
jgi:hypothetical protein